MRKLFVLSVSALALSATGAIASELGDIQQDGTYGAAYIHQEAEDGTISATIQQGVDSDSDTAAIVQTYSGSDSLSATITQNSGFVGTAGGSGNVAGIVQATTEGSTSASINQDGSYNTAGIRQRDTENTAVIDQDGGEQQAVVKQGDTPPGFAELEAENGNETTDIDFSSVLNFEGSSGGVFADGENGASQYSIGEVSQFGWGNRGAILQLGESQVATVSQTGDGNNARVQQAYEYNSADIVQNGIENSADVLQDGSNNIAAVDQDGYLNVALVAQHDTAGDSAIVDQVGDANHGTVHQSLDEVASSALITQNGTDNVGFISQ